MAFLLAASLTPPFVSAEARAVDAGNGVTIEFNVVVDRGAAAVLVRGAGLTEELDPVALIDLGDGRWSGVVTLRRAENITVAFELIPGDGGGSVISSEQFTLIDLGVDPAFAGVPSPTTTGDVPGFEDVRFDTESRRWGWLALAAGAGGLALLAFWVIGGTGRSRDEEESVVVAPLDEAEGSE